MLFVFASGFYRTILPNCIVACESSTAFVTIGNYGNVGDTNVAVVLDFVCFDFLTIAH